MLIGSMSVIPFGPPVKSVGPSFHGSVIRSAFVASTTKICAKKSVTIAR